MGGCFGCSARCYRPGDEVFFGRSGTYNLPAFGDRGLVKKTTCRGVVVDFGEKGLLLLNFADILPQPPLPDDCSVGTKLHYGGPKREYENGDVLNFGDVGEISGTCGSSKTEADRLIIKFVGHQNAKRIRRALLFSQLSIPGGYRLGERVYWCGSAWALADGDRLQFGQEGEIAGCTDVCDGMDKERVAVLFKGNKQPVAMHLVEISRVAPSIPGGLQVGDKVYYAWPNWTAPDGSTLTFGTEGKVAGCSCAGDGSHDEQLWVKFGDAFACIELNQITTEPPSIPGGFKLGEPLFYCGPSRSCNEGVLSFGEIGEVTGRAAFCHGIALLFPSNQDSLDVKVTEVCGEKPWIPGSFDHGEQVFYTGPCCSFPGGDLLVYGALGQVVGRSCLGDEGDDQRVAAVFQGNMHPSVVCLSQVSREVPADLHAYLKQQLERADANMHQPSPRRAASREQRFASFPSSSSTSTADVKIDWKEGPFHLLQQNFRSSGLEATRGTVLEDMAPFAEIASVYRTARDARLTPIIEDANKAARLQVKLAHESGDLALLSEIAREAEECGWTDLCASAVSELEQASLPVLLDHCRENDVLAHRAIYRHATSRGILNLAEKAHLRFHSTSNATPDSEFQRSRTDEELHQCQDAGLKEKMQLLLDETYTAWGGYGPATRTRDRTDQPMAERLEVDNVVVLSNTKMYLKYLIRQQIINLEMPQSAQTDWSVRTSSTSPISKHHQDLERRHPRTSKDLRRDLNECYLWHGTGPKQVESISRKGFDLQQAGSGRGSLFGRGLYFAESCLKADEYAKKNDRELFALILCRVTLGNVNYCDVEDPTAIRESLRSSCRASTDFYHSVLGDREKTRKTFREFVIFDENQAFPEYIVWYSRK